MTENQKAYYNAVLVVKALSKAGTIQGKGGKKDFVSERVAIASRAKTPIDFVEIYAKFLGTELNDLYGSFHEALLAWQQSPSAHHAMAFMKSHPQITAMFATKKFDEIEPSILATTIPEAPESVGRMILRGDFPINISFKLTAPCHHGADTKNGNVSMFRRQDCKATNNSRISVPFVSANSVRGIMRDLHADWFIKTLGLNPDRTKPDVALWFFHFLYSGGALEANSAHGKAIGKIIGENGTVKADGLRMVRDTLPGCSILGGGFGDRILEGRIDVADAILKCYENGYDDAISCDDMMGFRQITRREKHEGWEAKTKETTEEGTTETGTGNSAMIAQCEVVLSGNSFISGLRISKHASELEKSALGLMLKLLKEHGHIGAQHSKGLGFCEIEIVGDVPDSSLYENFVSENRENILDFLRKITAI